MQCNVVYFSGSGILSSPAVTTSPAGILTDTTYTITSAATTTYQETTTTQQATPYIYPESGMFTRARTHMHICLAHIYNNNNNNNNLYGAPYNLYHE